MTSVGGGNGLPTSTGPVLDSPPMFFRGNTAGNWNFPLTTGTISAMNTEMGSDARTPMGKGMITLVAGGTSHNVNGELDFVIADAVLLNFTSTAPTPSLGPDGLASTVLMLMLGAGYASRERWHHRR